MIVEMTEVEFKKLVAVLAFFDGYFGKRHPESDVREEIASGMAVLKAVVDRDFKVRRPSES